jgi:hypothetical protein
VVKTLFQTFAFRAQLVYRYYSGAEIKGLVGAAQSHALARYLQKMNEDGVSLADEIAAGLTLFRYDILRETV